MEWNEPLFHQAAGGNGRVGVLVIHGYSGSPRSLQELAERLVDAGYTVALPLLSGHGRTPGDLEKVAWSDWPADVEQALAWLKERTDTVFAVGLSMGGALALWVAQEHPEVAGVVTVNAFIRHPQEKLMRVVGRIGVPRWVKAVGDDINSPGTDEKAYDKLPSRSTRQLVQFLTAVRRRLPGVRCPVLLFSSVTDHTVPPANQREIYDTIASTDKALVPLQHSYHVATMDYDKEQIFSGTLAFIAAHVKRA